MFKLGVFASLIAVLMAAAVVSLYLLIEKARIEHTANKAALVGIHQCLVDHTTYEDYHTCALKVLEVRIGK